MLDDIKIISENKIKFKIHLFRFAQK